jgi:hypothetical protein
MAKIDLPDNQNGNKTATYSILSSPFLNAGAARQMLNEVIDRRI